MKAIGRYFTYFLGVLFLMFGANVVVKISVKNQMYSSIYEIPSKKYGLVLGTSKEGKHGINPYYSYRIKAAADLYFAQKIEYIIVSGDNSRINYNEPQDMYDDLVALGVDENKIIRDYAGFRTLDSVIRAKKVFNVQELIIISQHFHNERALFVANNYNMNAVSYDALDVPSKNNYTHFREFVSKFVAFLDVKFFFTQPHFLGAPY